MNEVIRPADREDVRTEMYLRDGFPHAVVCKVQMKNGDVGIGVVYQPGTEHGPAAMDEMALQCALQQVSTPDYTGLEEHVQAMHDRAVERAAVANPECEYCHKRHDVRVACPEYAAFRKGEEPDHDLQASLGQPAHQ